MSLSQTLLFGRKAVGLGGRGTSIPATKHHPGFLEMLLNDR